MGSTGYQASIKQNRFDESYNVISGSRSNPGHLRFDGCVVGESVIAGWAIEVTSDLLALNRGLAMSTLAMGVIVLRIPACTGNNLREPALTRGAINCAFSVNVS